MIEQRSIGKSHRLLPSLPCLQHDPKGQTPRKVSLKYKVVGLTSFLGLVARRRPSLSTVLHNDHSRSMAICTDPDVRKCRGRQACRAGNTCKQARRACTATKAGMQTGPIGAGYKRREVLREESRMAFLKGLCTRCQGSTARKDGEGHAVAGASVAPGLARTAFCRK